MIEVAFYKSGDGRVCIDADYDGNIENDPGDCFKSKSDLSDPKAIETIKKEFYSRYTQQFAGGCFRFADVMPTALYGPLTFKLYPNRDTYLNVGLNGTSSESVKNLREAMLSRYKTALKLLQQQKASQLPETHPYRLLVDALPFLIKALEVVRIKVGNIDDYTADWQHPIAGNNANILALFVNGAIFVNKQVWFSQDTKFQAAALLHELTHANHFSNIGGSYIHDSYGDRFRVIQKNGKVCIVDGTQTDSNLKERRVAKTQYQVPLFFPSEGHQGLKLTVDMVKIHFTMYPLHLDNKQTCQPPEATEGIAGEELFGYQIEAIWLLFQAGITADEIANYQQNPQNVAPILQNLKQQGLTGRDEASAIVQIFLNLRPDRGDIWTVVRQASSGNIDHPFNRPGVECAPPDFSTPEIKHH